MTLAIRARRRALSRARPAASSGTTAAVLFSAIDEGRLLRLDHDSQAVRVSPLRQPRERPRPSARRRALRRPGRRPAAGRVHARRTARRGRCAARRQVSQPAERSRGRQAAPHLFHRSAPSGDPVRPGDLSVSRSLLGAPPRAQRPPRLGRDPRHLRHRFTRARCCCRRTRRRSTSPTASRARASGGSCAPIPIRADGTLDHPIVLHTFGADHRGHHRGIEGMCLDADGNIVAVGGWQRSGPGPLVYVFSPRAR